MTRPRVFLVVLLCLAAQFGSLQARDRDGARAAFKKAIEYHSWFEALPASKRELRQYNQCIYLFRLVIDHDPTYGGSDDALYHIASLYDEMSQRFGRASYSERAVYYYQFLAREYPTTRFKAACIRRAEKLRNPSETPKSTPSDGVAARGESTAADNPPLAKPSRSLATLSEVRYWSNEDYTRVVLQLDREIEFSKEVLSNPDRIYFDLKSTQVDPRLINQNYEVNGLFITQIRVAENRPNVIRVVLDFDHMSKHTVFALYDPYRIVIDSRGSPDQRPARVAEEPEPRSKVMASESAVPAPEPPPSPPSVIADAGPEPADVTAASPTIQGNWTLTRTLGLKVGRVVIDPGHGGKDTGTIGPSGLREKDLVLAVALKLKELLKTRLGTDVILTRSDDRFIPLEERTAIANQTGADLFISIHANASRNRKASGIETYVLDFATSPAEMDVATRENASSQRNIRELEDLLRQIAKDDYNKESRDLASTVQKELVTGLSDGDKLIQHDRGVKQAPFIVLIGSNMPSILTEIGFVSNPNFEKFYKTEEGRTAVAESLFKGVQDYLHSLGMIPNVRQVSAASTER